MRSSQAAPERPGPLVPPCRTLRLEAAAAVDGLVAARLERHTGLLATLRARRGEHLTRAAAVSAAATARVTAAARTTAGATRAAAALAPAGLVHEIALLIEL